MKYTLPSDRRRHADRLTFWRCYGVGITIAFLLLVVMAARGDGIQPMPEADVARLADVIYRIEGGPKAKVPYGILSVKVKDDAEARRVCLNTIRNNWVRWHKAGKPGEYLDFLADRYCPENSDKAGNRNWKANVKRLFVPREGGQK